MQINKEIIDSLYWLYLTQFDLNYSNMSDLDRYSAIKKLGYLANELDSYNVAYTVQNSTAYLAESKDYYYQNSEITIKAKIADIYNNDYFQANKNKLVKGVK